MAITGIAHLPPEIILHIMECSPDVAALRSFILVNRAFHDIFSNHKNSIVLSTLKTELGEDLLVHAIVAHQVEEMHVTLPAFSRLSMDQIDIEVAILRQIRNQAFILHQFPPRHSSIQVTLRDADRISLLWNKISQLSAAFVRDCSRGLGRLFYPLGESVQDRPVSVAELRRVRHSMYMFHILSIFCRDLFLDIQVDQHNQIDQNRVDSCVAKIMRVQHSLVTDFMAPWELHQVISLQAWFRRQIQNSAHDDYLCERLIPYILSQGIECMHQGICIDGEEMQFRHHVDIFKWENRGLRSFVNILELKASLYPAHGFGMILSRGLRDNWTRKMPKKFDKYSPFWYRRDREAYIAWCDLETPKRYNSGFDGSTPGSLDILAETEGILDLWSSAFWDPIRWPDIRRSVDDDFRPWPWYFITLQWDTFRAGWESALDPEMRNGVMTETRRREPMRRLKMMLRSILEYSLSMIVTPAAMLMVAFRN